MIVMKFGGASLASPACIRNVARIVSSQLSCKPVVVVSALGDTTDTLVNILESALRGESYVSWKLQEKLKTFHFCLAEDLLAGDKLEELSGFVRHIFRDLHVRMLEVCDGEARATPEVRDWVLSLGEQLSSRIVAATFEAAGIPSLHMDARTLILTDEQFTSATPRTWETYAKIRWAIPAVPNYRVVVLGGFIGATEDGRTTTLGRGGSDLTASIVGAALNVQEIQVWKDVDGMLTWDPRIDESALRTKYLSYTEVAELAAAGATIFHPDSIAPAQRLRIPVVVRNTFRPESEGTMIGATRSAGRGLVKSVACKLNMTVLELCPSHTDKLTDETRSTWDKLCREQKQVATLLATSERAIYLSLDNAEQTSELKFSYGECFKVRIWNKQAIVTLVGHGLRESAAYERFFSEIASMAALVLPDTGEHCVRIAVPVESLPSYLKMIKRVFFSVVDDRHFALAQARPEFELTAADGYAPVKSNRRNAAATPLRAFKPTPAF